MNLDFWGSNTLISSVIPRTQWIFSYYLFFFFFNIWLALVLELTFPAWKRQKRHFSSHLTVMLCLHYTQPTHIFFSMYVTCFEEPSCLWIIPYLMLHLYCSTEAQGAVVACPGGCNAAEVPAHQLSPFYLVVWLSGIFSWQGLKS